MTVRSPRAAAASAMAGNTTRPPGVPLWKTSGRPSCGQAVSTSSRRPSGVASTWVPHGSFGMAASLIRGQGRLSIRMAWTWPDLVLATSSVPRLTANCRGCKPDWT